MTATPAERIDPRGSLTLRLTDRTGQVVNQWRYRNRIVKAGRMMIAQMFAGGTAEPTPAQIAYIGVGRDGSAPDDAQTDLLDPLTRRFEIREKSYQEFVDNSSGSPVERVRVVLTAELGFEDGNVPGGQLREAGSFNAASGGVMYNRVTFEPVTKTDAFKLTLLWDVEF